MKIRKQSVSPMKKQAFSDFIKTSSRPQVRSRSQNSNQKNITQTQRESTLLPTFSKKEFEHKKQDKGNGRGQEGSSAQKFLKIYREKSKQWINDPFQKIHLKRLSTSCSGASKQSTSQSAKVQQDPYQRLKIYYQSKYAPRKQLQRIQNYGSLLQNNKINSIPNPKRYRNRL